MTIKERIQKTGISISWFAKHLGIPVSTVSRHVNENDEWYMNNENDTRLEKLVCSIERALEG